ncbi:unnamed protein product, partial [marine sediment metagenome]
IAKYSGELNNYTPGGEIKYSTDGISQLFKYVQTIGGWLARLDTVTTDLDTVYLQGASAQSDIVAEIQDGIDTYVHNNMGFLVGQGMSSAERLAEGKLQFVDMRMRSSKLSEALRCIDGMRQIVSRRTKLLIDAKFDAQRLKELIVLGINIGELSLGKKEGDL